LKGLVAFKKQEKEDETKHLKKEVKEDQPKSKVTSFNVQDKEAASPSKDEDEEGSGREDDRRYKKSYKGKYDKGGRKDDKRYDNKKINFQDQTLFPSLA